MADLSLILQTLDGEIRQALGKFMYENSEEGYFTEESQAPEESRFHRCSSSTRQEEPPMIVADSVT